MPPARHHLAVLAAVSVTCLMWSDIPTADTYFGDSPWFEEWSHSGFGGELHGWKPTHAAWERMQALVRALLFPVVFYRVLTADAKHMNLLAPRVRSPSRALAVVFGSLWPRHGDWLGFFVLWTMVLCRCVLGLGEMLSSGVHTWHNVIHLLAPLPGILAGHWYFRNHSHFWEFVTVSPFGSVAEEDLPSDAVLADGTPVTMPETVALPAEEVRAAVNVRSVLLLLEFLHAPYLGLSWTLVDALWHGVGVACGACFSFGWVAIARRSRRTLCTCLWNGLNASATLPLASYASRLS